MEIQPTELNQITLQLANVAEKLGLDSTRQTILNESKRRLQDQRLRVLVVGEVNHGKSTLINALLGNPALPAGVTPTTKGVIQVYYGPQKTYLITHPEGGQHAVSVEQFKEIVTGKRSEPGQLEVLYPSKLLQEQIEFVDTPGINDIEHIRSLASRGELLASDVLIFVLDATQALNRTELLFLRDAITTLGGFRKTGMTLFIVLNRIDLVDEKERVAIAQHVERELKPYLDQAYELFQISAKINLKEESNESFASQEFQRLKLRIQELARQRATILPIRMRSYLARHAQLLSYHIAIQARALTLEDSALDAEISTIQAAIDQANIDFEQIRTTIVSSQKQLLDDSTARIQKFHNQLETQTLAQLERNDLRVIADVLPAAVQDSLMQFSYLEAERIQQQLDQLTQSIFHTSSERGQQKFHHANLYLGLRGPNIQLQLPSVITELSMLAVGVAGTAIMYFGNVVAGMMVTVAAPLTTMMLRERSIRILRETAKNHVPHDLAVGLRQLEQVFTGVIDQYLQELQEYMLLANQQLMQQLHAVLQRAKRHKEAPDSPNSLLTLRELEHKLTQICADLTLAA